MAGWYTLENRKYALWAEKALDGWNQRARAARREHLRKTTAKKKREHCTRCNQRAQKQIDANETRGGDLGL